MAYRLLTVRDAQAQDSFQWSLRSLEDEVAVCDARTLTDVFLRHLPRDGLVVEAGCGLGGWVRWLGDHGFQAAGIDRYETVVTTAKRVDPSLDIRIGAVESMPFADDSIAAYISLGVVEHFEGGPEQALTEAFRVLRRGGVAVVSTPALTTLRRVFTHPVRSSVIAGLRAVGRKAYFGEYRFTRDELVRHLENAGFVVRETCLDEMKPTDARHIGLYADFPVLRDRSGAWRLNRAGQILRTMLRTIPDSYYASANCVVAVKP